MDQEDVVFSSMIEKKIEEIAEFIKKLPEDRKKEATWGIIYEAIIWGSYNDFEGLGILEDVKLTYREESRRVIEEEIEEEEGDIG